MICPFCKRPLVIEKVTIETVIVCQEVIGVSSLGYLEYEASGVVDTVHDRTPYFRCSWCQSDLKLAEAEVIEMIRAHPDYGQPLVARWDSEKLLICPELEK